MSLFPEFNDVDVLAQEDDRLAIKTIPIHQNKLKLDKGKIKEKDTESFKLERHPHIILSKHPEKCLSNTLKLDDSDKISKSPSNFKRSRIKSESVWRQKLNEKDSCVILQEMIKQSNPNSDSKALHENYLEDDDQFFISESDNEWVCTFADSTAEYQINIVINLS